MIKNLPDKLNQLQSEHVKGAKRHENIILRLEGKEYSKSYFNALQRQYAKSNNSELYADDNKTKYSSNPNDTLKSVENFYEKV